jgi:hypothetical protein
VVEAADLRNPMYVRRATLAKTRDTRSRNFPFRDMRFVLSVRGGGVKFTAET